MQRRHGFCNYGQRLYNVDKKIFFDKIIKIKLRRGIYEKNNEIYVIAIGYNDNDAGTA